MDIPTSQQVINISGAGPAGLAAAIAVANKGSRAVVYEKRDDVGHRFHGDFRGLENWTTEQDVLHEFSTLGITANFDHQLVHEITVYGPNDIQKTVHFEQPLLFGMVNRWFYNRLGNKSYSRLMQYFPGSADIRKRMHHEYDPRLWKQFWYQHD